MGSFSDRRISVSDLSGLRERLYDCFVDALNLLETNRVTVESHVSATESVNNYLAPADLDSIQMQLTNTLNRHPVYEVEIMDASSQEDLGGEIRSVKVEARMQVRPRIAAFMQLP